ncbi:MAG: AlpA family phage regulatory protein [Deltaproteobacteria bacterium]|nr:AlpA family phage regulatory protein [Deltaproteobacteria bacterium]
MDTRDRIIREKEAREITSLSRTSIWRYERDGCFPRRIKLGRGAIGWRERDIYEWLNTRQQAA